MLVMTRGGVRRTSFDNTGSKLGQAEKAPSWDPRDLWVVRCRVLTCPENQNAYFITRVTPIELKSSVSMV